MGENIRELQRAVVEGLARLGMPSPERHCVVQVQTRVIATQSSHETADEGWEWRADAAHILVARVRFHTLARRRQQPIFESVLAEPLRREAEEVLVWAGYEVPVQTLARVREEYVAKGFSWPAGWPVVHEAAHLAPAPA